MTDRPSRKFAAVLHADVAGSTALVQQDEATAHERIQDLFRRFAGVIGAYSGTTREVRGDALVAEFARPSDAVTAALAFQAQNSLANQEIEGAIRPGLRVGISLGEVIVADNTVTGAGVVLAQRLEQLASPGGVVIQGSVAETVPSRLPFEFENLGEQVLKGFDQPVRAFTVRVRPGGQIPEAESLGGTGADPGKPPAPELPDKPSIVVLPFDNMSSDPEQEYFSDGVCEDIITDLSKISGLFVIARNSSFAYKGRSVNVPEVCLELGVKYALEGSVRKAGNRLRITAQLIDGSTGGHLWAERYDRELADIFELQDEVTREIIAALAPRLTRAEQQRPAKQPTSSLEAYDCFMRGRELWWRFNRKANQDAQALFERAIELDPEFAMAYGWLAASHLVDYVNDWAGEDSGRRHADLARRALELDDGDAFAQAQLAMSLMMQRQHDQAIVEGHKAIELDPNFAHARMDLAWVLMYSGRYSEALSAIEEAQRLDPHMPGVVLHLKAMCQFHRGRLEDAVAIIGERLTMDPHSDVSNVLLASCYGHLGRPEQARAAWARALAVNPNYSIAHKRKVLAYKDPADLEYFLEGLRKAGIDVGDAPPKA